MTELLPCPFCGNEAEKFFNEAQDCVGYQCANDLCPVIAQTHDCVSYETAAKAWNTRAADKSGDDCGHTWAKYGCPSCDDKACRSPSCKQRDELLAEAVTFVADVKQFLCEGDDEMHMANHILARAEQLKAKG